MRKVLLTLALCLALLAPVAITPAQATDRWQWSHCNASVMWAEDHQGFYNYWHTSMSPSFNGFRVWGTADTIYARSGYECGALGHPLSNVNYRWNEFYPAKQNFNCGILHFRSDSQWWVQWWDQGCIW